MKPRHFAMGLALGLTALSPIAFSADPRSAYVITSPPAPSIDVAPSGVTVVRDDTILVPDRRIVEDVFVVPAGTSDLYVAPAGTYYIVGSPIVYARRSDAESRETHGLIDDGLFNRRGPNDFGN